MQDVARALLRAVLAIVPTPVHTIVNAARMSAHATSKSESHIHRQG
jgi:hypothetical protein